MTKNIQIPSGRTTGERFEQLERRINVTDRRTTEDRRSQQERRLDSRLSSSRQRKTMKVWLRSLTHARLGVDRRKKEDRRTYGDRRRQPLLMSLLTREEIDALLS